MSYTEYHSFFISHSNRVLYIVRLRPMHFIVVCRYVNIEIEFRAGDSAATLVGILALVQREFRLSTRKLNYYMT